MYTKKIKKFMVVMLCVMVLILQNGSFCISVKAEGGEETEDLNWIELNEENFPDENLRNYLKENCYYSDGKVYTYEEYLFLDNLNISSIKGLEYFKDMYELDISNNNITSIDANFLSQMLSLDISYNPIKIIDISSNPDLCRGGRGGVHGFNGGFSSYHNLFIDNTQSVISPEPITKIIICVPQTKGYVDLNNIQNFDSDFLIGVDKANSLADLSFNSETNRLYYDFSEDNNIIDYTEYENANIRYSAYNNDDNIRHYECTIYYKDIFNYVSEYDYEYEEVSIEIRYKKNETLNAVPIQTSGIYCASTSPSIVAGMVIDNKAEISKNIEYQWLVYDEAKGTWAVASDWTLNNEYMNYTPAVSGNYIFVCKARIVGNPDSEVSASFGTPYTKTGGIKQICQMPYEGGGYLIGFESYENPNQEYQYEMFVMDLSLLAAGSPTPWVHATGKITLAAGSIPEEGKTMWTIWQPQYGYYLTLFRLYDKDGNMIDEVPYGFANAY